MILLVTPCERAAECGSAIREATGEEVNVAESLAQATTFLRAEDYLAVVFDQYLQETEAEETETTLEHIGTAIPLHVNLGISSKERLVREVCEALRRRGREEERAREAALGKLHHELNGTLTALLLCSELALETPDLPGAAGEKLQAVRQLVEQLRSQLAATTPVSHATQAAGG